MLYRSHQPTSVPTGRPSNRVGPAFRRLENRSRTYEKRRQHRSHRSWPTEREPIPPSELLSFTLFLDPYPPFSLLCPLLLLISSIPRSHHLLFPTSVCVYVCFLHIYLSSLYPTSSPPLLLSSCYHPFVSASLFNAFSHALHRCGPSVFRVASLSGCCRNNDARVPLHIGRWSHFGPCCLRFPDILFSSPPNRSLTPFLRLFSSTTSAASACRLFRCVVRPVPDQS